MLLKILLLLLILTAISVGIVLFFSNFRKIVKKYGWKKMILTILMLLLLGVSFLVKNAMLITIIFTFVIPIWYVIAARKNSTHQFSEVIDITAFIFMILIIIIPFDILDDTAFASLAVPISIGMILGGLLFRLITYVAILAVFAFLGAMAFGSGIVSHNTQINPLLIGAIVFAVFVFVQWFFFGGGLIGAIYDLQYSFQKKVEKDRKIEERKKR